MSKAHLSLRSELRLSGGGHGGAGARAGVKGRHRVRNVAHGTKLFTFKAPFWHRTKIVCTLGPATDSPGVLEQLIRAGMDVARINASHSDHASHTRRIEAVRQVAKRVGEPVAILLDLPGPKFRVGELAGGQRALERGAKVTLQLNGKASDCIPILRRELLQA